MRSPGSPTVPATNRSGGSKACTWWVMQTTLTIQADERAGQGAGFAEGATGYTLRRYTDHGALSDTASGATTDRRVAVRGLLPTV
ncbi:hypothetical protein Q0Z83_005290 [Actinoplanes sichuanensis]|nr:hypothetical protein Q0Z83_005290 [Actinoplanes sichuanensis]